MVGAANMLSCLYWTARKLKSHEYRKGSSFTLWATTSYSKRDSVSFNWVVVV